MKKILSGVLLVPLAILLVNPNPTFGKTTEIEPTLNLTDEEKEIILSVSSDLLGEPSDLISPFNVTPGEPGSGGNLIDYNTGSIGIGNLSQSALIANIMAALSKSGYATAVTSVAQYLIQEYKHLNFVYYTEFVWEIPHPRWPKLYTAHLHEVYFYSDRYHRDFITKINFTD